LLGTTRGSRDGWRARTAGREQNPSSRQQDRPNKRTVDGRPKCKTCAKSGHILRSCHKGEYCYNCGMLGHFSPQCPTHSPRGWYSKQDDIVQSLNCTDHHPQCSQTKYGGRGELTVVFNFPQADSRHLIIKEVDCQGRIAKAVIDTGPRISLVSSTFCRMLGMERYREWEGPRLLLANGNPLVPEGSVKLRIYVEGRLVWVTAAVSGMNRFDLLLGNDALSQLGRLSFSIAKLKWGRSQQRM
jgi:hypothetical protein